jgi:hypothetical protein
MQLAKGYVDVLKMFIAASITAYEYGFSVPEIQTELERCTRNTANRPLLEEEMQLRFTWVCVVYLTLDSMKYYDKSKNEDRLIETIPAEIRDKYQTLVRPIGEAYQTKEQSIPSVDDLLAINNASANSGLSPIEKAIISQSLRVATLTPVVLEESKEAQRAKTIDPPKPPIKGAFE